jgi:hypothetical protein
MRRYMSQPAATVLKECALPAATVLKEAACGASAINHALSPELLVLLVDMLMCFALV